MTAAIRHRLRSGLFGRPHRAGGRAGRTRRARLPGVRVPRASAPSRSRSRPAARSATPATIRCSPTGMRAVLPACRRRGIAHHHEHGRRQSGGGARAVARSRARLGLRGLDDRRRHGRRRAGPACERGDFPIAETRRAARRRSATRSSRPTRTSAPSRSSRRWRTAPTSSSPAAPPIRRCFVAPQVHEFGWRARRLARLGRGHARRPSARVRGPGHRRLLRRSRLQGRRRTRAARLSDRRSRAPTAPR